MEKPVAVGAPTLNGMTLPDSALPGSTKSVAGEDDRTATGRVANLNRWTKRMNFPVAIAVISAVVSFSACVSPIAFASKKTVSLAYVGAVSFGAPVTHDRHLVIPLIIDYQRGEWSMNSASVAYGTTSRVRGRMIEFSVLTSLPVGANNATLELRLPKLAVGDYAIGYLDPDGAVHALGSVTIKE